MWGIPQRLWTFWIGRKPGSCRVRQRWSCPGIWSESWSESYFVRQRSGWEMWGRRDLRRASFYKVWVPSKNKSYLVLILWEKKKKIGGLWTSKKNFLYVSTNPFILKFLYACSVISDSLWPHGLLVSQVPLSMWFFRQESWSGLPFPAPGDLADPGIEPGAPVAPPALALAGRFFTTNLFPLPTLSTPCPAFDNYKFVGLVVVLLFMYLYFGHTAAWHVGS